MSNQKEVDNFLDACIFGITPPEAIEKAIETWNKGVDSRTLQEFLGFSEFEYNRWLSYPDCLDWFVKQHARFTYDMIVEKDKQSHLYFDTRRKGNDEKRA